MKKTIIFIIAFSLIISSAIPVYAVENTTGAAIKSLNSVNNTKATTPSTTVEPEDSSATRYYVISNGNVSSSSVYINTWGNIVNDLTYSFAYSIAEVVKKLTTINNNMINYLFSNASTGYYLWDWTTTGGVYQGAPTSSQSVISQLRAMGSSITKMLSYNTEYAYQAYQLLLNGGLVDKVKIDDNTDNNFTQNYIWKKYLTNITGTLRTISPGGVLGEQTINFQNLSVLGAIEALLYYTAQGTTNGIGNIIRDVRDNNAALSDYTYDTDLNPTMLPRTGMWANLRQIGSNLSMHLARLDYVLASDDEIAAREAAQENH